MVFKYQLPDGWQWTTIEAVQAKEKRASITGPFGSSIGRKFFVKSGIPVIRGNNLTLDSVKFVDNGFVFITDEKAEELKGYKAFPDDLIFTAAGTIGQVGIIPKDCDYEYYIISNKQMRVRFDTSIVDPEFAYYWFSQKAMADYLIRLNTGSTIPLINLSILRKLPMPLPPMSEQNRIKNYLASIDQKVTLNRQTNQTLESMAQALFKSWFVDFDPVIDNALAAGNAIPEPLQARAEQRKALQCSDALDGQAVPQLPEAVRQLFPNSFVLDAEMGWIPEGWTVLSSGSVIDVRDGTHDSPKKAETGYHLVTSKHITTGELKLEDAYLISPDDYAKVNQRSRVDTGDILLTMIGTVGIPYLVMQPDVKFAIKNIGLFRTSETPTLKNYFFYLLKSQGMQDYLAARQAGTTQKYLSLKVLRNILFVFPSEQVLQSFDSSLEPILRKYFHNTTANERLANLRNTLLPKLISGELRIPEAETLDGLFEKAPPLVTQ